MGLKLTPVHSAHHNKAEKHTPPSHTASMQGYLRLVLLEMPACADR